MHVLHKFFGFNINTTAFCLGRSSLHLLLVSGGVLPNASPCYTRFKGWSAVVNVVIVNSNDPISSPTEVYSFFENTV